ncbi:MAG TPA: HD family hydrolase [Pyrinomonadaceae bacterium]|nr:HD family hydrolase [Pyrinomonadaceae bacterium]
MLSLLIELQRLKRLDRTGWILRGLPNATESVAAHSFGVSVTAMLLADEMKSRGITIDVERVLRMSLLHDWAETRIGDMPRTATHYFGSETRKKAETTAFADIVAGVTAKTTLTDLHEDYEKRQSLEARVVKAADIVDLLVQALALERAGARGLDEFWEVATGADFQLPPEARPVVDGLLHLLLAERNRLKGNTT